MQKQPRTALITSLFVLFCSSPLSLTADDWQDRQAIILQEYRADIQKQNDEKHYQDQQLRKASDEKQYQQKRLDEQQLQREDQRREQDRRDQDRREQDRKEQDRRNNR